MKITRFETFLVPPRWLFLKIETDEGLAGWGEPVVEGKAETVRAAVHEFEPYLIGQDPMRIEDLWQKMFRGCFYRGGAVLMSAIAGIDQALWDIKGKFYRAPVHELLGGAVRDRMRVYTWIGGDRPEAAEEAALEAKRKGFTAVKMNATAELGWIDSRDKVERAVARVAAVRQAVGGDFGIALDFHGRVHRAMAKILVRELEPYHPMFIEEPVLPEHNENLREIARQSAIPIATGERMYSRWDFKRLLQDGYVDIIQPDLSHAGGITECRKIAAMAEAYDVAVAPHCPLGPIALAASLQVDAVSYNAFIQEQSMGIHYNVEADLLHYLKDPSVFAFRDGNADIPAGPGLGVEIDEDKVRERLAREMRFDPDVWFVEVDLDGDPGNYMEIAAD